MTSELNLDSLVVGPNGRAFFNGLGSGIDIQGAVDALIKAKRIPIDRMEQRIADHELKMAALGDTRSLALRLRDAVAKLRGAISFDGASDVFEAKQTFATSTRTDSQSPSQAAELIGVSVTNAAQAASHSIEVLQVATAHKVASAGVAGAASDPLGLVGNFEINGRTVAIDADDSLIELRDRINAANSGDDATGVRASIVSISATEQVLVLTADETGTDASIGATDIAGGILQSLGILDGLGGFGNELQVAQNAEIKVDGLATTIERQSNTIDDVFSGVTLSLFKAEPGTTVQLDVERDLSQIKQAIVDFVGAYNELRSFLNLQAQTDVPEDDETGAGILAGTSSLSDIRARLAS
jgi:flagellar hook-associated protein 2